jgi:hypothetical protein
LRRYTRQVLNHWTISFAGTAASIYVPQSSVVSVELNRRLGKKEYWFWSLPRCQDQFEVQCRHVGEFSAVRI